MNLPEKSINYIDVACFLMKKAGGILHNYQFASNKKSIEESLEKLHLALKKNHWEIENVIDYRTVKAYSPKLDLIVIDLLIKPKAEK